MNHIIVDKTYTVELLVTGSGVGTQSQQLYFPILQVLDQKLTQKVETYLVSNLTKSPGNVALANTNLIKVCYLNLQVGDVQQIWNIPLIDLINTRQSSGGGDPFVPFSYEFNNLPIIWAKSYVFIADLTKVAAANEALVFNIGYTDIPAKKPTPAMAKQRSAAHYTPHQFGR